ncbi:phage tail assembly chaperone [Vibrio sp. Isolate31]|uniref:phage tail assembly chaperone n=1 Tax=Vibrio TaxID=662 RepID=UPI001B306611|nr:MULTISPECIES: phage tail assembly chaperone [Vibrio]MCG9599710.1 phage tail assembly chaperone [Vibrio sp. Isolate31]
MTMLVVTTRGLVAEEWVEHIEQRDRLMVDADHLVNTAMDMELDVTPFRQYRQALRDIPQTYSNPEDVVWPQKPSLPQASA